LNSLLTVFQKAHSHFCSYDVFPSDWEDELHKVVEAKVSSQRQAMRQAVPLLYSHVQLDSLQDNAAVMGLLFLGHIVSEVELFSEVARKTIKEFLTQCMFEAPMIIFLLGMSLARVAEKNTKEAHDDSCIAQKLLSEFPEFESNMIKTWNQNVPSQTDIASLLKNMVSCKLPSGDRGFLESANKDLLIKGVKAYNDKFTHILSAWKKGSSSQRVVEHLQGMCQKLAPCTVEKWASVKEQLPELLATIAAFITISKSGDCFKRLAKQEQFQDIADEVLMAPHNIQVLCLLHLLGYDTDKSVEALPRQLAQVGTGEGKSLILAMISLLLGLLGFRVWCVCYSQSLQERDRKTFEKLFDAFGVHDQVTYCTIAQYSEAKLAEQGDIRRLTEAMLKGSESTAAATLNTSLASETREGHPQEILLLDEVDMFFSPSFYGRTHDQVLQMAMPEASELLRYIWQLDIASVKVEEVEASDQFKQLKRALQGFSFIADREVQQMCHDRQSFENERKPYHVDVYGKQIGYKVFGSICYDIIHGYQTAFAYLKEEHRFGKAEAAMERALSLRVSCGHFCYDDIHPACILGVSGTLSSVDEHQRAILANYKFTMFTVMPSVYNKFELQLVKHRTALSETREDQFRDITTRVKKRISQGGAVVVFFKSPEILMEYNDSTYYEDRFAILSEDLSSATKDFRIKKAATSKQATFTHASFGRGTDFACYDRNLSEAGGVEIIQAFFSLDKTEEVQIQGRTARQGHRGSWGMCLCIKDLEEEFGVTVVDQVKKLHETNVDGLDNFLGLERSSKQKAQTEKLEKDKKEAEKRDLLSQKYFRVLLRREDGNRKLVFEDLFRKTRAGNHFVFCLDNSWSMTGARTQGVEEALADFIKARKGKPDKASLILFATKAVRVKHMKHIHELDSHLPTADTSGYYFSGTHFEPALEEAGKALYDAVSANMRPVIIFMTDGDNWDGDCLETMSGLSQTHTDLECHCIFYNGIGWGRHLEAMSQAEGLASGSFRKAENFAALKEAFNSIALGFEYTK